MDIVQAFRIWASCDGREDKCSRCPLYDADPDNEGICNHFSAVATILEERQAITKVVYLN